MQPLRILVIEDDALIGMLLADLLEGMGHDVVAIAATEDAAVAAAERFRPEFMTVDARLRDGNGVDAVGRIERHGAVPHVFISGGLSDLARPGAIVLQKPFVEQELVRAMHRALGGAAPLSRRAGP
jgi:DNA-binding response OmpR family regulator